MAENTPELRIRRIDARCEDVESALAALREQLSPRGDVVSEEGRKRTEAVFGEPLTPQEVVQRICSDVEREGWPALCRYTEKLDGADLADVGLRVSPDELAAAHARAEPDFLGTIQRVKANIESFQRAILHGDVTVTPAPGIVLRQRYTPLRRVGVCVPGGAAAYPSTVLMTAVPALVAGVQEVAVIAPPTPFGANNTDVLATCHEIGVSEVYRIGGAQGVAALAYGVDGLPPVDMIVGPGNLFVALAKKHVYGTVKIDSIAGPSEVVVWADETTRAEFAAADMLAQAEHAPGASILITWHESVLEEVARALARQVAPLSRSALTRQSLEAFGTLILVRDEQQACEVTNLIAPEHLHLALDRGQEYVDQLMTAGATFVGNYSPVAVGDYVAGPSHVLPTGGTGRWASGLTANDFLRGSSVIAYDREALQRAAGDLRALADKEGLTAHRASVDIRLD